MTHFKICFSIYLYNLFMKFITVCDLASMKLSMSTLGYK